VKVTQGPHDCRYSIRHITSC